MQSREEFTITREQVIAKLNAGHDWQAAAEDLGIAPSLAFMIATGVPADGSGVPELADRTPDSVAAPSSPQDLLNDRRHNPLTNERVNAWVKQRATRELTQ